MGTELVLTMSQSALGLCHRLFDPNRVMLHIAQEVGAPQNHAPWFATSASAGPLPAALLFDHLDRCFPNEGYDHQVHAHLGKAVENLADPRMPRNPMLGMFSGLAGLGHVVYVCSRNRRKYTGLIGQLDDFLLASLEANIADLTVRSSDPWRSFDIISGSAGVVRYLLARHRDVRFEGMLRQLVDDLVQRSESIESREGFLVPHADLPSEYHQASYPTGYIDSGLAHGVPGVLASLSLVAIAGLSYNGLYDAVQRLSWWVQEVKVDDDAMINWPAGIDPRRRGEGDATQLAWCYGTPGVSMALLLASEALGDEPLRHFAERALLSTVRQPELLEAVEQSPILCHGVSGLLQICFRFLQRSQPTDLIALATRLSERLILLCDQADADGFGGYHVNGSYLRADLLEGAAGVALALASAHPDAIPEWDQMLMLA